MQLILNAWKARKGGPVDASAFLKALESPRSLTKEKELIIDAFDEWDVLTNTWFEIADSLPAIEKLYEDATFAARLKAALLASKVAFCLEQYDMALQFALSADTQFKLTPRPASQAVGNKDEEYVNKMIEVALDTYKCSKKSGKKIDARLDALINRLFERNLEKKEFRYVIGLALETCRVDMIKKAIESSSDVSNLLTETVQKALNGHLEASFRNEVLDTLLGIFGSQQQPDFVALVQCLIRLEKPSDVADLLSRLLNTTDGELMTYQIAFDLYENASQQFILKILAALKGGSEKPASRPSSPSNPAAPSATPASDEAKKTTPHARLRNILNGEETIKHHMQFLIKNNHTDMLVLKEMKDCVRTATAHNATLMSNGIMHLGTTCDDFLRDNLDWISKATNWNKFNAVSSLGLIHKGHESAAMKLLDPYLPKTETDQYGFKEGGSLYALGLIHANHGNPTVIKYLRDQLTAAQASPVRHGACLGLGLAAMGTHDQEVYAQLREALYLDDAVTGEAAGLAMGLVMVGSLHQTAYQEMVQYVCDTQHDKIQRGLRTGISYLAYGRQEECEQMATTLLENKSNAVLRSTGICMLAMAYVGTGKANVATRLLEKVATDPNNDVKRFAVMSIGFLLSNDPEICLSYVGMLVEHFNSHVRYGAAMALGIACAGSGYKEAIALIEPLVSAKENFVRQGAVIALSFIYVQQTDATCSKVPEFRKQLTKMVTEKGEDSMAKFGAIVAQGILDAGGRNLTISLHNRTGHPDMGGVVGMMAFQQYWYWHSMVNFISLVTKPTCLIALNKNLAMPKMEFKCNAKASLFAYPPALESKKKEEHEKVETAVLSITNKKKSRAGISKEKEPAVKEEKMEVDHTEEEKKKEEEKKAEAEPLTHLIENPCRVVRLQLKTLALSENARYKPVKSINQGGIVLVRDRKPTEAEDLVAQVVAGGTTTDPAAPEKEPHSTFEIDMTDY